VPDKIWEDIYHRLRRHRWGVVLIVVAVVAIVLFAIWNSLPDVAKERVLAIERDRGKAQRDAPDIPADCAFRVSSFSFEPKSPYLSGMTDITIGMLQPEAIQRLERCHVRYRIEADGPLKQRLEVTPADGLLSGITYYAHQNVVTTIGFSLSSTASDLELRRAAHNAFGPPDRRTTMRGFHYDWWSVAGMKLSICERGGSFFADE
jgi:hypothetical protein